MAQASRTKKTFLNARINTISYFVGLLTAFFTRKILLDHLGLEFMGLSGTLQSVLGFLNLAELGVGTAIGYVLYKPIYDDDKEKIQNIISVLGYLYRMIGYVILGAGVVLSVFLPWMFQGTTLPLWVVFLGFYSYLCSTLLTYFANYRISLLSADHKLYKYTGINQLTTSTKVVVQMLLAYYTHSLWLYLLIELAFSVVNAVVLHRVIRREYPWLAPQVAKGRALLKAYPEIVRYIKQLFIHRVSAFVQMQTLPLFIYAYVSLPMVAIYGNYTLITQRVQTLLSGILSSSGAGVGHLISEGDSAKIWRTFKQLLLLHLFLSSVCAMCIYFLINAFMTLWLGNADYLFADNSILLLIVIGFFLWTARGVFDQFLYGYGLFYDVWAPFVEALISIVGSVVLGHYFGLSGVVAAPLIALLVIVFGWKPYFLFSRGLKQPIIKYVFYMLLGIGVIIASYHLTAYFTMQTCAALGVVPTSWGGWIAQATLFFVYNTTITMVAYFVLFADFRAFILRFIKRKL